MKEINNVKYTCDDCRWKDICPDEVQSSVKHKCSEFELDTVLSDKYAERLIEQKKKESIAQWNEMISENNA